MKASARSILSATTALGLTAFATVSAFTANASASVAATAFGLLAIYGIIEMMILSYGPRHYARSSAGLRVVPVPSAPVHVTAMAAFPTSDSHRCAA